MRNTEDGTVEAVFEGEPDEVDAMIWFVRDGPGSADVDRVEVDEEEPEGLRGFKVRLDAAPRERLDCSCDGHRDARRGHGRPGGRRARAQAAFHRAGRSRDDALDAAHAPATPPWRGWSRSPRGASIQRCGAGGHCGGACGGGHAAEEELLEEQLGAGLLRSAVARRSA